MSTFLFPVLEEASEVFDGNPGGEGKEEGDAVGHPTHADHQQVEHAAAQAAHDAVGAEAADAIERGALADSGGAGVSRRWRLLVTYPNIWNKVMR